MTQQEIEAQHKAKHGIGEDIPDTENGWKVAWTASCFYPHYRDIFKAGYIAGVNAVYRNMDDASREALGKKEKK